MAAEPNPQPTGRWSGLRVLLIVSLALNLLVIGSVAGLALRWHRADDAGRPPPPVSSALMRALPKAERAELRAAVRQDRSERVRERRADARQLAAALRAQPFDAESVLALLEQQGARRAARLAKVQDAWIRRVAAMPPAERAAYAQRVEEVMTRRHKPHGKDAPKPE